MYVVEPVGDDISASIDALPVDLLDDFAQLCTALELTPWTVGRPLVPSNPTGLRVATIGSAGTGLVVFHVLEHDRVVALVQVGFL